MDGRDYLVRQLRDHKASIEDDELKGDGLGQYARVCGELLAKGHARSGDPCVLDGYMGNSPKFDKAIAKFAVAYADQTSKDFEVFTRALRSRQRKSNPAGPRSRAGGGRRAARRRVPEANSSHLLARLVSLQIMGSQGEDSALMGSAGTSGLSSVIEESLRVQYRPSRDLPTELVFGPLVPVRSDRSFPPQRSHGSHQENPGIECR
jgi:Uncharacterized protein conserved in bacteria (DUF2252)